MKKIYCALFALLTFASCKKSELPTDNGCISQIKRQNFGVTAADSIAAINLLKKNNLPTNDLVLEYVHNDTITYTSPSYVNQYVFGVQYIKGLPILSDDFGYSFKDGNYTQTTGKRYNGVILDTRSTLSLPVLRNLFIKDINKNLNSSLAVTYKDSCLTAEFGYYNLNTGKENTDANFVKAWAVRPKHRPYPLAIFRDDNAQEIVYYTGIVLYND